jgi:hypothetical protein
MATSRKDRLRKVLTLQEKLKQLHETRHAMHLSGASAAEREAREISERIGTEDSLSDVFPEIYHRRVANANQRRMESLARARVEAERLSKANARVDIVGRNYREAAREDERQRQEVDRLEEVARRAKTPK